MKRLVVFAAMCALSMVLALAGCAGGNGTQNAATSTEPSSVAETPSSGTGTLADGTYEIEIDTDSSMFHAESCTLKVEGGQMTATLTLPGEGFSRLCFGTIEEAETASDDVIADYYLNDKGKYTFDLKVPTLDEELDIAAWGQRRDRWYQHTITFLSPAGAPGANAANSATTAAANSAENGTHVAVSVEGGTGKASIVSPAQLTTEGDQTYVTLVWTSSNYDKMVVDGVAYTPTTLEPGSTFVIPVAADLPDMVVEAETTAMSQAHLIEYTLHFGDGALDDEAAESGTVQVAEFRNTDLGNGWKPESATKLDYAACFTIDNYQDGYQLACLSDGGRYLLVPKGASDPTGIDEDIVVIHKPISDIYLVASDTACLFDAIDAVDAVTVSGIKESDWYVDSLRDGMKDGTIAYGGRYNMPDYELLLSKGVTLAVESTMINHTPDVREKLVELGIPVLVEMSSYESEPLGRAEWVKLYGALCDKEAEAEAAFQKQIDAVNSMGSSATGKTVAFFYINSNGAAVIRRPGDYVTSMIEQAGGTYFFTEQDAGSTGEKSNMSSMTLEMEQFYATAKDADIIIYNSSIDDSVKTTADLLAKNELLAGFKAVKDGNVWATEQNMYQQMMNSGGIIADMHQVFTGASDDLTYMHKLS